MVSIELNVMEVLGIALKMQWVKVWSQHIASWLRGYHITYAAKMLVRDPQPIPEC